MEVGRFAGLPAARAVAAKRGQRRLRGCRGILSTSPLRPILVLPPRAIRSSARLAWRVPTGSSSSTVGTVSQGSRYHDSAMPRE